MSSGEGAPIFDREGALERVDQDTELFCELRSLFFEDYPATLLQIEKAISDTDAKLLMESAHSVKSALGNLGAMRAFEHAYSLEKLGREGTIQGASELLKELASSVAAFSEESAAIC